jgi:hypothetical protein
VNPAGVPHGFEGDAVAEGLELGDRPLTLAIGVAPDEVVATTSWLPPLLVSRCASSRITPATYKAIGIAVVGLPTVAAPSWSRARVT